MVERRMFRLIHIPILWAMVAVVLADAPEKVEEPPIDIKTNPASYLENDRLKFGINLTACGSFLAMKPQSIHHLLPS